MYIAPWLQTITETYICESKKYNLLIFTHVSKQNSPPGSYHFYSRQEDITHFPQAMIFENLLFPAERGKDYEAEKITKIKLSQVLINPTIFATYSFLWSVLQFHNLNSTMLKCEGSLT